MPLKLPNNDAARAIQRVGADTIYRGTSTDDDLQLEQASDSLSDEQLGALKGAIASAQDDASNYLGRNTNALNWWCARWPNQFTDGRKWPAQAGAQRTEIWPWPGASDTRDRTVEMVVNEHVTVGMFALQNMKVQARSTRPLNTIRQSSQGTTLLNWQLFTHMKIDLHREMLLAMNWRFGYGSAVLGVDWEQERRLDRVPVTLMTLQAVLAGAQGGPQGAPDTGASTTANGPRLDELASMLIDSAYEDDFIKLIQSLSPIVTKGEARKALNDLRQLRSTEIPVPYVFKSSPRIVALRPGVDVLFPAETGDLQHARLVDRIERVSESELMDRIETSGYDADFVDECLNHRGESTNDNWQRQTALERGGYYTVGPNTGGRWGAGYGAGSGSGSDGLIELHHVSRLQHDRGTPVLFNTVLHLGVDFPGKHAPTEYDHGQFPFHAMRMEHKHRAILTSEGIPEKAYTWEQELKAQADAQTDRSDLALRPPIFTDSYEEMQKFKASYMPTAVMPVRRHGSFQLAPIPQYDIGSVQIVQNVMSKVDRFFGIFGQTVDPDLKQMRRIQLGSDLMTELHPVIMQIFQLDQQFLPDAEVAAVVGTLARPFHVSRQEIQDAHEISATIDMRQLDADFFKTAMASFIQLAGLDTMGLLDRAYMIRAAAEMISPDFAENAIHETEPATQKEQQDEIDAISKIMGSGIEQPLPQGANYQLRLTTLQNTLNSTPYIKQRMAQSPDVLKIIENRELFFQRQLQQQQNAQIGRIQVSGAFSKSAPLIGAGVDGG